MKRAVLLAAFGLLLASGAYAAPDAGTKTDAKVMATTGAASQPAEPAMPKEVAKDAGQAIDQGKGLIEFAKAKQWFAFSAGAIWLLMFLFKLGRTYVGFMQKIPKRVLWIVVPVLSVVAMLLAKFQGDLSWGAAIAVLTSGPSAAFLNDFVKRGLLNQEPSPMKPS